MEWSALNCTWVFEAGATIEVIVEPFDNTREQTESKLGLTHVTNSEKSSRSGVLVRHGSSQLRRHAPSPRSHGEVTLNLRKAQDDLASDAPPSRPIGTAVASFLDRGPVWHTLKGREPEMNHARRKFVMGSVAGDAIRRGCARWEA